MRRVNLDFPWRKVGFGTNHRKINDLVLTVDQEAPGGREPPAPQLMTPEVPELVHVLVRH
jgi:hypothetical protein